MFNSFLTKLKSRQALAIEAMIVVFAFLGAVYGGTRLGANIDHSTTFIHGGHTLVVPGDSLGGFMSGSDKTKLDGLGSTMKGYVDAWSTSNITTLSGLANTVDGIAVSGAGMVVCSAAQTTTTQDGCYLSASGTWTRLSQFAAGSSAHGAIFEVISGTSNKGVWAFTNASGSDVVGTNDLTAINVAAGGGGLTNPLAADLDFASLYKPINMVDPVAPQGGATREYVDQRMILVDVVTTSALPAYTVTGAGIGKTITVTANGVCPTIEGLSATVTGGTFGSYNHVLLLNGASAADNGVYTVTNAGSAGTQCVLTRSTRADEAREIVNTKIRVTQGLSHRGAEYTFTSFTSPTVDTTGLYWTNLGPSAGSFVDTYRWFSDFDQSQISSTVLQVTGTPLLAAFTGGTSAPALGALNNAQHFGVGRCLATGATTARCGWTGSPNGTFNDGGSVIPQTASGLFFDADIAVEQLSDGTNTYNYWTGYGDNIATYPPTHFIGVVYQQSGTGGDTHWQAQVCNTTCTLTPSTNTVVAGTFVHVTIRKDAGDGVVHIYLDGVEVGTGFSGGNVPLGNAMAPMTNILKSAGTGGDVLDVDWMGQIFTVNTGRAN